MVPTTLFSSQPAGVADEYAAARQELVREIEANVRASREYLGKEALDSRDRGDWQGAAARVRAGGTARPGL